jgi:predicted RNA binding protein YcfA (HicA-like mRNA interferase family)
MPKLPAVKPREVARFIESRGFLLDHISGSPFIYFNPGTKRRAVIPQHNRDLPKGTLLAILRETGFTREEFLQFLDKS